MFAFPCNNFELNVKKKFKLSCEIEKCLVIEWMYGEGEMGKRY